MPTENSTLSALTPNGRGTRGRRRVEPSPLHRQHRRRWSNRVPDSLGAGALDYAMARAIIANYEARLAKIDYEERIKKLVNADEVSSRGLQFVPDVSGPDAQHRLTGLSAP